EEPLTTAGQLLSSSQSDLAKEASQLIQYNVLLTCLLEGKENMLDSILGKLELTPDTAAVDYVKAAVALQHKSEKEAKDWMAVAEKNFSPQLNKLFAESLFEVGWLEKPAGRARASLPLMTAAERSEKTKAVAHSKFEQAQQALRRRDFGTAGKLVDEAAQAIMEQFQFTGDTPALYYAQAAWEFKHNNPEKASDWTASAKRIYSPALNSVFADAFYDVGWMQSPEIATASESAFDAATVMTTQTEASPAIEPSPIPDTLVAASKQVKESNIEPFPSSASGVGTAIAGIGTRSSEPNQSLAGTSNKQVPAGAPEESKAAAPSTATSAVESSVAVAVAAQAPARTETKASGEASRKVSPVAT